MTTTHTPGPWHVPDDRRDRWIRSGTSLGICRMPRPADLSEQPARQVEHAFRIAADAALIAAAPDLLRLLAALIPFAESRAEDMAASADDLRQQGDAGHADEQSLADHAWLAVEEARALCDAIARASAPTSSAP